MDNLTPDDRRRTMASVRATDTSPELTVRRIVHGLGFRFRLHQAGLPGKPDLVFASRRKIIFVHGCFWHRHSCDGGRSMPTSNRKYWMTKLERNRLRDRKVRSELRRAGWSVLTIWECQTRPARRHASRHGFQRFSAETTFPRSQANPTRSTRLPILSLRVSTGCCLSHTTPWLKYNSCFFRNGG